MYKINFPVPEDIAQKAMSVASKIKESDEKKKHAKELIEVIYELSEHGISLFFMRPVEEGKFGLLITQSVNLAIKTTLKTLKTVVYQIVRKLRDDKIDYLAGFILEIIEEA